MLVYKHRPKQPTKQDPSRSAYTGAPLRQPQPQRKTFHWSCPKCAAQFEEDVTPELRELFDLLGSFPSRMYCAVCTLSLPQNIAHTWNEFDERLIEKVLAKDNERERIDAEVHFGNLFRSYERSGNINEASKWKQRYRRLRCARLGIEDADVPAGPSIWWQDHCPRIFQDTVLDRLPNKLAAREALAWKPSEGRGLILHGVTQLGKTRTAWLLLRSLVKGNVTAAAFDMVRWSDELMRRFQDGSDEDALEWLDKQARVDILFWDDIDKCAITPRTQTALFNVLKARTENKLPVIVTTNLIGAEQEQKFNIEYGAAFMARLRDFCDVVSF